MSIVQSCKVEDQQLLAFVQHATQNLALVQHLVHAPGDIISDQCLTSSVASIVLRLVPHLSLTKPEIGPALNWWAG